MNSITHAATRIVAKNRRRENVSSGNGKKRGNILPDTWRQRRITLSIQCVHTESSRWDAIHRPLWDISAAGAILRCSVLPIFLFSSSEFLFFFVVCVPPALLYGFRLLLISYACGVPSLQKASFHWGRVCARLDKRFSVCMRTATATVAAIPLLVDYTFFRFHFISHSFHSLNEYVRIHVCIKIKYKMK